VTWVQPRLTSYELGAGRKGAETCFTSNFFGFPLLIIIPPFLHIYAPPPPLAGSDQAARYYIVGAFSLDLTFDPTLKFLQNA
jgi:hypothetical protein